MAKRIHQKYPAFSLAWLMFGCGESLSEISGSVARIPVYRTLPERLFRGEPDDCLILSAASSHGAEFAVPYADDLLNPVSAKFIAGCSGSKKAQSSTAISIWSKPNTSACSASCNPQPGSVCPFNSFARSCFARFCRAERTKWTGRAE